MVDVDERPCDDDGLVSCLEENCGGLLVNIAFIHVPNDSPSSDIIDVYECSFCGDVFLEGSGCDGLNVYSCVEGQKVFLFKTPSIPDNASLIDGGSWISPVSPPYS
jgi:hypothetical protein